jgi:hypothetical protein
MAWPTRASIVRVNARDSKRRAVRGKMASLLLLFHPDSSESNTTIMLLMLLPTFDIGWMLRFRCVCFWEWSATIAGEILQDDSILRS